MSSAYWWNVMPKLDITSPSGVVNSEKSSGPRTDPCDTPVSELRVVDIALPDLDKE